MPPLQRGMMDCDLVVAKAEKEWKEKEGGRMNIFERTAWRFRLKRNTQSLREEEPIETHTPEPEFIRRQWDIVNQLRAQVRFYSSKVNEMRAKTKPLPSPNYIYNSIKGDDSPENCEAK